MSHTTPAIASRVILSLCDFTGNWSRPYEDAGYRVERVDIATDGRDVRLLPFPGPVHGILAAPPCTKFCRLGNAAKRTDADYREALSVVDACLRLVAICRPQWWALENPPGQLARWLGPPAFKFQPCDFGDPWTKLTYLWGNFAAPRWTADARPCLPTIENRTINADKRDRSATPEGFSRAFMAANP